MADETMKALQLLAQDKNIDPLLAEILIAIARGPEAIPCPKCGSRDCGPVRCRFEEPK